MAFYGVFCRPRGTVVSNALLHFDERVGVYSTKYSSRLLRKLHSKNEVMIAV
jgi:hypothetical protein